MHRFETPNPPRLTVEFRSGSVTIETRDVDETTVELTGDASAVAATIIEQRGDEIVVLVPRRLGGLFSRGGSMRLSVVGPRRTSLAIQSGSASVTASGEYGTTSVSTGSGDVAIAHVADSARLRSGSGAVRVERVDGDVDATTGSGDIAIGAVGGAASTGTGSGDISVDEGGTTLRASTGSGDVSVGATPDDTRVKTASGDIRFGRVSGGHVHATAVSGRIHAGLRAGTAAWLDVRTVSGRVSTGLDATDPPAEGERQVRLSLETVSGNIELVRV